MLVKEEHMKTKRYKYFLGGNKEIKNKSMVLDSLFLL